MKAMILAAGCGTRMQALTKNTPKVLLEVVHKPLIAYHLQNLQAAGVTDVVVNLHYLPQQIKDFLGNGESFNLNIHYSPEDELLGMGGGVYKALPLLGDEPFIVVSGDMWTDYKFAHLPKKIDGLAHLVMVDNPAFHPEGDYRLQDGKVFSKGENNLNYAGFGVFCPEFFQAGGEGAYGIDKLLQPAMAADNVSGEHYHGLWANLNTVADIQDLEAHLQKSA